MKKEFVRNPYNYDSDELSQQTGLACPEPTLTQQQFLEESDINYIADKFMKTGELKQVPNLPSSGDFSGIFDFQSAMNLVVEAKHEFMQLPAKIRSRFNNDPAQILAFLDNPENRDEAIAIGLLQKPPPQAPDAPKGGDSDAPPSASQKPPKGAKGPKTPDPEGD